MKRVLTALRVALSIGALVAALWHVDLRQTLDLVREATLPWVGIALAMNCVAVVLSTILWRTLMDGSRPHFAGMLSAYLEGLFFNNAGVGTVFGDASRVDALVSRGAGVRHAVASVVAERCLSLLALLALSSVGSFFLVDDHLPLALSVWIASVACLSCLVVATFWGVRLSALQLWPASVRAILRECADTVASLHSRPRSLTFGATIALAVQCCTVLATMAVLRSLGQALSLQAAFVTVPVIALCVLLPFSIQGIGVREATYIYVLSSAGVPSEVALTAGVLSFSMTLFMSVPGALIVLGRGARAVVRRSGPDDVVSTIQRRDNADARAA